MAECGSLNLSRAGKAGRVDLPLAALTMPSHPARSHSQVPATGRIREGNAGLVQRAAPCCRGSSAEIRSSSRPSRLPPIGVIAENGCYCKRLALPGAKSSVTVKATEIVCPSRRSAGTSNRRLAYSE